VKPEAFLLETWSFKTEPPRRQAKETLISVFSVVKLASLTDALA